MSRYIKADELGLPAAKICFYLAMSRSDFVTETVISFYPSTIFPTHAAPSTGSFLPEPRIPSCSKTLARSQYMCS